MQSVRGGHVATAQLSRSAQCQIQVPQVCDKTQPTCLLETMLAIA